MDNEGERVSGMSGVRGVRGSVASLHSLRMSIFFYRQNDVDGGDGGD